jgi:transcriptional regulator with PAS, ATPase and Fis domain
VLLLAGVATPAAAPPRAGVIAVREGLTIGRGKAAASEDGRLVGLADKLLSRAHLTISPRAGGYDVEDAGSLNGTYLDGRRLDQARRLIDGAVLFFGAHAAVFRSVTDAGLRAIEREAEEPFGPVATVSPALALTLGKLRRLAPTGAEILLLGETGVGKEVYARAVHGASGRKGPFVAINCAALPTELAESELFGVTRGAHSTAVETKPGLAVAADGGTLFLDEIGDMPLSVQAKLLRFLQDREVRPLGSMSARRVDVRVMAATCSCGTAASGQGLRPDLAARLGADPIELPPLRDRLEDLGALIAHFAGDAGLTFEPAAFRALFLYPWPRNVRELEKTIERLIALNDGGGVRIEHLPSTVAATLNRGVQPGPARRRPPRVAPSRGRLEELLRRHDGNVSEVARSLDRRWNVVWRWLVRHHLAPDQFRPNREHSGRAR